MSSRDYTDFIKGLALFKVLRWKQHSEDGAYVDDREVSDLDEAHVVSSLVADSRASFTGEKHKVILDIDIDSQLIPSTTPGNFHLYIDKELSWDDYKRLLNLLGEIGIVEPGYVLAAERRGFTCVRLPWVKKGSE